jgi:hypothetical protein
MPTAPLHHGWAAAQAMVATASFCSCGEYSSCSVPSELPLPRRSTRNAAMPCCANHPWSMESPTAVRSD